MRNIAILILICITILAGGCANAAEEQKSDEPKTENTKNVSEERNSDEPEQDTKSAKGPDISTDIDIRNTAVVYDFINKSFPDQYTAEDFNKWNAYYLDVTKDGRDDVVYTTTYGDGKLERAIVISVDHGELQIVPSDIMLAKYKNEVSLQDGFVTIVQQAGGSGIKFKTLNLMDYNGEGLVPIGVSIVMEDVLSMPDGYAITGTIEGPLTEFVYTAEKEDYATEEKSLIEKVKYTYDSASGTFMKEDLMAPGEDIDEPSQDHKRYLIENLQDGDEVGGMTLENLSYQNGGDKVSFDLTGCAVILGSITIDDAYGDYMVKVQDSYTFGDTIIIRFPSGFTYEFGLYDMYVLNAEEILTEDQLNQLHRGEQISGKISISKVTFSAMDESEGGTGCEIVDIF